jgi:hypothetical protein
MMASGRGSYPFGGLRVAINPSGRPLMAPGRFARACFEKNSRNIRPDAPDIRPDAVTVFVIFLASLFPFYLFCV